MEIRLTKTREGLLLAGQLPPEISSSQSLELFLLRDGAYLLTVKGFVAAAREVPSKKPAQPPLSEKEKSLLRKLLSIRFESRVPADVAKLLSKEEKELLEALIKKELVQIFHGGKYEKGGVYNVSDFAFNAVREPVAAQPQAAGAQVMLPASSPAHLEKFGWMVLENEADARDFGNAYSHKVKSGEYRGQRAFDRRFYFVTRQFFESHEKEVLLALSKSEKTSEEIASQLGMAPEGCRAVLVHLLENGEVMEKKKGKFAKA